MVKKQEWADISNEEYRKYLVVTGKGIADVIVKNPKGLKVEKIHPNGDKDAPLETEHIILTEDGEQHRITYGWLKISFKMKDE